MCCKPQPSLIRLGTCFFLRPVRFGVWYIRISTLSPNSSARGARSEALEGSGASRVPRRQSVRMLTVSFGLRLSASRSVSIYSASAAADNTYSPEDALPLPHRTTLPSHMGSPLTSSCSDLPIYRVARNTLLSAPRILAFSVS